MSYISTFAYIEEEARREESDIRMADRPPIRMPSRVSNGGFQPMPMATLTPEQARAAGWDLYRAIVALDQVLAERGQLTDAIVVNVWGSARATVRRASKVEAVAASDSPTTGESDAAAGVGETTAVEAARNQSSPGS